MMPRDKEERGKTMELDFCCPLCGAPLLRQEGAARCENHHSFDLARQGYLHLLPRNRWHSSAPGDSKEMVESRRCFLEGGYYRLFQQALTALSVDCLKEIPQPVILDVGAGEGYYTGALAQAFPQGSVFAIDISKAAVKAGAGKYKNVQFGVASIFHLPVEGGFCHLLTDVFAPIVPEEFARVVKPGGYLLLAVPSPRHLYGMKEILYDKPYENERKDTVYPGFGLIRRQAVEAVIEIPDGQTARQLFTMTPYWLKTSPEGTRRLLETQGFTTEIGFDFLLYQRIE